MKVCEGLDRSRFDQLFEDCARFLTIVSEACRFKTFRQKFLRDRASINRHLIATSDEEVSVLELVDERLHSEAIV